MEANIYQSVLKNLSALPEEYLIQVNAYLQKLKNTIPNKDNKEEILSLAGSWSSMSNDDFDSFLSKVKESGEELFGRDIEL